MEPAKRRVNGLMGPFLGRIVAEELDDDFADFLGLQPGHDRLAQPGEALLEGGQHLDGRGLGVGAGIDEAAPGFGGDPLADFRWLREAGVEVHRCPLHDDARDAFVEHGPETVHFGGDFELVVDDGGGVLYVPVVDGDGDLGSGCRRVLEMAEGPVTHEIRDALGGFPE